MFINDHLLNLGLLRPNLQCFRPFQEPQHIELGCFVQRGIGQEERRAERVQGIADQIFCTARKRKVNQDQERGEGQGRTARRSQQGQTKG